MHLADNTLLQGGKYRIVRFIASGGFGCTYEAVHTLLGQRVAIKEYFFKDCCVRDSQSSHVSVTDSRKQEMVERFRRKFIDEARNLASYKHPGIVNVFDVFEENDTAYYVMDYIDGLSLSQMVKQRGPLPQTEVLGYMRQVCDALAYVHAKGRLHLDIKPGNIMVESSGKALLIDFGASKQFDEETGTETTTTPLMRSPGYAPLEQVEGLLKNLRASTDIYALGATLYKLLTGITPPVATLLAAETAELTPLPTTVSPNVQRAILTSLQIASRKRPQSVAEFLAIIDDTKAAKEEPRHEEPVSDNEGTVVSPIEKVEPTPPESVPTTPSALGGKRSNVRKYLLIGGCALALVFGLYFFLADDSDPSTPQPGAAVVPEHDVQGAKARGTELPDEPIPYGDSRDVITTASGLKYRVIRKGEGPSPLPTSVVTVRYTGKFTNGQVFDSSDGQTIEFPLNGVIAGFSEGLQLMNRGAIYELTIPGNLAYGPQGIPGVVGPNETLVFEIELVDFH